MFMLSRWKPRFLPYWDLFNLVPIWVRLLELPLEYWDEGVFIWIGDYIGHFIEVYLTTISKAKLYFSRICVNVGMNKSLLTIVSLKFKWGA